MGGVRRRLASRFQRLGLAVVQEWKCAGCGKELEQFEAHHLKPFSKGGETELWNLEALCGPCHSKKHQGRVKHRSSMP
jgi:5-methylcytosine-specific restriction endonuclease McrA